MGARGVEKTRKQNKDLKISHPPRNPITCKKAIKKKASKERTPKGQVRGRRKRDGGGKEMGVYNISSVRMVWPEVMQDRRLQMRDGGLQDGTGCARWRFTIYLQYESCGQRWCRKGVYRCKMGVYNISSIRIVWPEVMQDRSLQMQDGGLQYIFNGNEEMKCRNGNTVNSTLDENP